MLTFLSQMSGQPWLVTARPYDIGQTGT